MPMRTDELESQPGSSEPVQGYVDFTISGRLVGRSRSSRSVGRLWLVVALLLLAITAALVAIRQGEYGTIATVAAVASVVGAVVGVLAYLRA